MQQHDIQYLMNLCNTWDMASALKKEAYMEGWLWDIWVWKLWYLNSFLLCLQWSYHFWSGCQKVKMAKGNGWWNCSHWKEQHLGVTNLPQGHKTISVKWMYKTKLKENCDIDKHKARLVAKDYKQEYRHYKEKKHTTTHNACCGRDFTTSTCTLWFLT